MMWEGTWTVGHQRGSTTDAAKWEMEQTIRRQTRRAGRERRVDPGDPRASPRAGTGLRRERGDGGCPASRSRTGSFRLPWPGLSFCSVLTLLREPAITLSPLRPAVKHIDIPGFLSATYYEGELGMRTTSMPPPSCSTPTLVLLIRSYLTG